MPSNEDVGGPLLILAIILAIVWPIFYWIYLTGKEPGQTVGKKAPRNSRSSRRRGLRDRLRPSAGRYFITFLFEIFYIPLLLDYLWPLWDGRHQRARQGREQHRRPRLGWRGEGRARPPPRARRADRRLRDLLLGYPLPALGGLADDGGVLPLLRALPFLWPLARLGGPTPGPAPRGVTRRRLARGAFFAPTSCCGTTRSRRSAQASPRCSGTCRSSSSACSPGRSSMSACRAVRSVRDPGRHARIVLISGCFEDGAYGDNPALGALYGVLTGLRTRVPAGAAALERPAPRGRPLFEATLASMIFATHRARPRQPRLHAAARGDLLADRARVDLPGDRLVLISISLARLPTALTRPVDPAAAARGAVRRVAGRRAARPSSWSAPPRSWPASDHPPSGGGRSGRRRSSRTPEH